MDNNAPILRRYVAEAKRLPSIDGVGVRYFHAVFGFPGGRVDYVRDALDTPAVYPDHETAENEARRVLIEALNSRSRFNSKREISTKMTGDEFAAELAETGIPLTDFAQMWGTKQDRVVQWIQGEAEVPFPLRWVLKMLRRPEAVEQARSIVAENVSYKPAWLERRSRLVENEEG